MNPVLIQRGSFLTAKIDESQFQYTPTDAGRSLSTRSRQKNDCTVRAVALTLGISYDTAYDTLAAHGRKCSKGFHIAEWLEKHAWATKLPFPAVKGQSRMNPQTFTKQFQAGRYICRTAKHVFAEVDGVVMDTSRPRPNRCIYSAWRIEHEQVRQGLPLVLR